MSLWTTLRKVLVAASLPSLLLAGAAHGGPERETPQYGGTINIATRVAQLNALTWNQYKWQWKVNHDGLFLDYLVMGDLEFGPRGSGETNFHALD